MLKVEFYKAPVGAFLIHSVTDVRYDPVGAVTRGCLNKIINAFLQGWMCRKKSFINLCRPMRALDLLNVLKCCYAVSKGD